ncbi:methyl-accepting chemotaxis protein [Aestuariirhabdus litorea]|uniref:Methyl-accepting chemotaxis protein n=1 Tax=Aestuariirhabdus litorea TaxID=2528527 RepID=A0A3P3VLU2_9GAMM|nr:methyl-accepting chemotaxis protein [Aestuariirhabdus litorea]RRJ82689.1 methyl-accepting chemotaxis protein [Aestuariirhabdus litorea]RWW92849.1 HAMP domain-containing protein [Endozoicomonadaceae bacterium GTF-13]
MQLFHDLSIGKKIGFIILLLTTLLVITSAFGLFKMNAIGNELQTVQSEDMPLIEVVSDITIKQLETAIRIERAMRLAGMTSSNQTIALLHEEVTALSAEINAEIKQGETILVQAQSHALSPQLAAELETLSRALKETEHEHQAFEAQVEQLLAQLDQGQTVTEASVLALESSQAAINEHLATILKGIETMTEHALETVHADEASAFTGMSVLTVLSVLLGMLLGTLITRAITRPLAQAVDATQRLANGDLTVQIEARSTDETGQLLSAMQRMSLKLQDMVSQIAAATEQLSGATNEVATITTRTAKNIELQTEQLSQTSVAMNEMSATVRDVAHNASDAADSTATAEAEARKGEQTVEQVNHSIHELALDIEHTSEAITRLSNETENVDSILEVITSIAEQTNLLALNAAIEAARAGEQGRGFAVVADEVRTLASRTQDSISTIQTMIGSLKSEAKQSVEAMNSGYAKANQAVELSEQAASALVEINQSVDRIAQMNTQIASAAEQQSAVAEQVNRSVSMINESQHEASSGAQQVAVATEELAQLSENLKGLVGQFKLA